MTLHERDPFVQAARRYCDLIDSCMSLDAVGLVRALHSVLPPLLNEGSSLPPLDSAGESSPVLPAFRPDAEREQLRGSLSEQLGDYDLYWEVFDPHRPSEDDPVSSTLGDDLADIYWELKRGLAHTDGSESAFEDSMWHWRFGYESHWGHHLIDAIRSVHSLMFVHGVSGDA